MRKPSRAISRCAAAWRCRGKPDAAFWGEADDTVGRIAAEGTAEFICADYRFAPLPGVGHYAADQRPVLVNELLLDHLVSHPV
jgi:pimeloyl-ACP methyl ester carboxylesterase